MKGIGPSFSLQSNNPFDCNSHNIGTVIIKSFQNCNYEKQGDHTEEQGGVNDEKHQRKAKILQDQQAANLTAVAYFNKQQHRRVDSGSFDI